MIGDRDKDGMPPFVGEAVQVGEEFGRVRLGYWGSNPDAGNFEVEMADGTSRLVPWDQVTLMTWEQKKSGVTVPPALAAYSAQFGR